MLRTEKNVLVVASISFSSGRDLVSGIFAHLSGRKNWRITLVQEGMDLEAPDVRAAIADGLDGFIVSRPCREEVYDVISDSGLPCVHIFEKDVGQFTTRMRFVTNDNHAVGRVVADYFLANGGYASYAFYGGGMLGAGWVAPRLRGFAESLAGKGRRVEVFPEDGKTALRDWLRRLPRPAALMAAKDEFAAEAIDAAQSVGLSIPEHIAVMGVDDALHEVNGIGLSSVLPGHFEMGNMAARMLDGLMEGRHVSEKPILVMPRPVVARASTSRRKPAARIVMMAREFIVERACSGIGVDDVVARVGVSRSTLEHRFREVTGQSVRQTIEGVQLAKAMQRLSSGRGTLGEIAKACGFSSANRLSHVFSQRFGKPPRAFRP